MEEIYERKSTGLLSVRDCKKIGENVKAIHWKKIRKLLPSPMRCKPVCLVREIASWISKYPTSYYRQISVEALQLVEVAH